MFDKYNVLKDKNKLKKELDMYGSLELMAYFAIRAARNSFTDFYPVGHVQLDPFMTYVAGLFLTNNNMKALAPYPISINQITLLLEKYFWKFWMTSTTTLDNPMGYRSDLDIHDARLQYEYDMRDPHVYPDHKDEYYQKIFSPLDQHFISRYGFSIERAKSFAYDIMDKIQHHMQEQIEQVRDDTDKTLKHIEKRGHQHPSYKVLQRVTHEGLFLNLTNITFFEDCEDVLIINPDDYCTKNGIKDRAMFKRFLNGFSCSFGKQFKKFNDPASDNIIFYKPIIKINEEKFFLVKPDFLCDRLDLLLEYMLEEEKQNRTSVYSEFTSLKSRFLKDKAYEFISRIFPAKHIFQNAYYCGADGKQRKVDLLVIYDNNILIIDSESGILPLAHKRTGDDMLIKYRLDGMVKDSLMQCVDVGNYIKSQPKAVFYTSESRDKVLVEIDKITTTDYKFFFIDVTLEDIGETGVNPKNRKAFSFLKHDQYPWAVYLHDLDIITDLLSEPIYFINYIQRRITITDTNNMESDTELVLLDNYLNNGTLSDINDDSLDRLSYFVNAAAPIKDYYHHHGKRNSEKKPQLAIPKKLEKLLLNMQKYYQLGFTDIVNALMDFPLTEKKDLVKNIEETYADAENIENVSMMSTWIEEPYDICFFYYASKNMTNFYKACKQEMIRHKRERKATRLAMIGRNVLDKKNYATFFMYDYTPVVVKEEEETY